MQKFKGDAVEDKFINSALPALEATLLSLDEFFESAYETNPFKALLYDEQLAPFCNSIRRDIFIESLDQILDFFALAGSFESYLLVFRKVFGEDVIVNFTVPSPGKLEIDITAVGLEESIFLSREIINNSYVYDEIIDDEGDNIVFQSVKGFTNQYELEKMLFEMVPAGVVTDIDLEVGG